MTNAGCSDTSSRKYQGQGRPGQFTGNQAAGLTNSKEMNIKSLRGNSNLRRQVEQALDVLGLGQQAEDIDDLDSDADLRIISRGKKTKKNSGEQLHNIDVAT